MSHPAIQPKLGRTEVMYMTQQLNQRAAASRANYLVETSPTHHARAVALEEAAALLTDMWIAAVISADAVSEALAEAAALDDGHDLD